MLFAGLEHEWFWGTPYIFGGRHEYQGGLDCAGFVMAVFDRIGIDIDPLHSVDLTSAQRLLEACEPIPAASAGAGDLIFFRNTYPTTGASHVGIVQERGIMLDDHQRTDGTGPGTTNYTLPYWQDHFLGFGRVRR